MNGYTVHGRRLDTRLAPAQQKRAQVVGRRRRGRAADEVRQRHDVADVVASCFSLNWRMRIPSSMRWRSGLVGREVISLIGVVLRLEVH